MLYTSAISDLSALRNVLQGSLATTAAEDARVLTLVQANHVKTTTSLSKTRMQDSRNASPSVAGECVTAFKTRIDELEAEIATLWKEWEGAEHAVRKTYAELVGGGINGALGEGVQDTLKQDLEELEGELEEVLDSAWEEARASEKVFSVHISVRHFRVRSLTRFSSCRSSRRRATASCPVSCSSICLSEQRRRIVVVARCLIRSGRGMWCDWTRIAEPV